MKKILSSSLLALAIAIMPSAQSFAAPRSVLLKPSDPKLGVSYIYLDGSQTPSLVTGGGGQDLNSALIEDGQFALLDPQLPGPGQDGANSLLVLNYEKNSICSGATIQAVKVHVIWKASELSTMGNDLAVVSAVNNDSANPSFTTLFDSGTGVATAAQKMFGGLATNSIVAGGTFSGNVPTALTHDSSTTQTPMSLDDLNNPDTRIVISMGDSGAGDFINISGQVDYAYLEVTYDDANCAPSSIDPATISSPKTGSVITGIIIATALAASIGASLFGVKRTKLKHRASERE